MDEPIEDRHQIGGFHLDGLREDRFQPDLFEQLSYAAVPTLGSGLIGHGGSSDEELDLLRTHFRPGQMLSLPVMTPVSILYSKDGDTKLTHRHQLGRIVYVVPPGVKLKAIELIDYGVVLQKMSFTLSSLPDFKTRIHNFLFYQRSPHWMVRHARIPNRNESFVLNWRVLKILTDYLVAAENHIPQSGLAQQFDAEAMAMPGHLGIDNQSIVRKASTVSGASSAGKPVANTSTASVTGHCDRSRTLPPSPSGE